MVANAFCVISAQCSERKRGEKFKLARTNGWSNRDPSADTGPPFQSEHVRPTRVGHGPRTLALRASQGHVCTESQLDAIIVIVIGMRKRHIRKDTEKKKEKSQI